MTLKTRLRECADGTAASEASPENGQGQVLLGVGCERNLHGEVALAADLMTTLELDFFVVFGNHHEQGHEYNVGLRS